MRSGPTGHAQQGTSSGRRLIDLTFATLSQAAVTFAQQGIAVLGVFFVAAYHLTLPQMASVVSTVTLGWMLGGPVMGSLVDRLGPRLVVLSGTLAMSLTAAAIGSTRSFQLTWALLLVLGLSIGAAPSAGTKAVLMEWPAEKRGLPMGIRQMGVPAGSMVAALLLPTLAAAYGLHGVFRIFAAILLVCGLGFSAVLPPNRHGAGERARRPARLRYEVRGIAAPALCGFLLAWGQYAVLTFTIPMLHGVSGLSVPLAGAILAAAQAGGACARIAFGAVSDRLNGRHELVLSAVAALATVLALIVALMPTHAGVPVFLPLWFALGVAMIGWNALLLTWAGERVSIANAGTAMGLTTSAVLLGASLSPLLVGRLVEATGSFRVAWLALSGILCCAALLLWMACRRSSRAPGRARLELSAR